MIDRFASPEAFQLFWLLPVLLILAFWLVQMQVKKIRTSLGQRVTAFLTSSVSLSKRKLKIVLEVLTIFFFIFALARPQGDQAREEVKSEGIEIMILADVSKSMLSEDVRPSRMELMKRELIRFLDMSPGDRVGLIAFAGSAVLLSPLTTDKSALKMYIESLSTDSISNQGTDFKRALQEAQTALARGGLESGEGAVVTRALLVASDGEDHEQGALDFAKDLTKEGVRIFTLGFGTEKGGPIPIRDVRGSLIGYLKDSEGKVVLSTTKGTILRSLAESGQGSFHHVTFGGDAITRARGEIKQLEQAVFEKGEVTNYSELFQIFLLLGLMLALIELLLGERRPEGRLWKGRFEVKSS